MSAIFTKEFLAELVPLVAAELRASGDLGTALQSPWTPQMLAEKLGVSHDTIRRRIHAGTIARVPEIGRTLIPFPEVKRLMEGRAV